MRAVWTVRLLLAALMAFGYDILYWRLPTGSDALDTLAGLAACLVLSVALPDLMQRERVRDIIGLVALAGLAALTGGLLIVPRSALDDIPLSLLTHSLGAPTALMLLALGLWLALLRARSLAGPVGLALLAGAAWGLTGHWALPFSPETAFSRPLASVLVAPLVVGLLVWLARRSAQALAPDALRLSRPGWWLVVALLVALLGLRLSHGLVGGLALAIVAGLMAFTWLIARLYRHTRAVTLLDRTLPPGQPHPRLLLAALAYVVAGGVAYGLPRADGEASPVVLFSTLMIVFGLVWLPALSVVIGFRALVRQMRAQQL